MRHLRSSVYFITTAYFLILLATAGSISPAGPLRAQERELSAQTTLVWPCARLSLTPAMSLHPEAQP